LDVLPRIVERYDEVLFVFVGNGNLFDKIATFADEPKRRKNILLTGEKPREELPMWLNAADLLVIPSLSEGRPNIVLEAMACGIPIVGTRVGGIPELISNGDNGILVPPNDAQALTNAVLAVLEMTDSRETLGRKSRELVESLKLDWASSAERMTEIYQKVLAREY
jgi:glycosyltransferase involved in cell wall biosynthesis